MGGSTATEYQRDPEDVASKFQKRIDMTRATGFSSAQSYKVAQQCGLKCVSDSTSAEHVYTGKPKQCAEFVKALNLKGQHKYCSNCWNDTTFFLADNKACSIRPLVNVYDQVVGSFMMIASEYFVSITF